MMYFICCCAWKGQDLVCVVYSCPIGNEFIVLNSFKAWNIGYDFYLCRIFDDEMLADNYANFIERSFSNEKIPHP